MILENFGAHLKTLGYGNRDQSGGNIVLDLDGEKCSEAGKVTGAFNDFYTKIASDLVGKLHNPFNIFTSLCSSFKDFYTKRGIYGPRFSLTPVSGHFIIKQLLDLNPRKSTGLDDVSPLFLRDGAEILRDPLCHIVNLSITSEMVPSAFKQAQVKPLFKKCSRLERGNYRPVSILNVLSKILERAVHGQFVDYLNKSMLFYEYQSGFRAKFSTDSCLINLTDFIRSKMSQGKYVGMVLLDFQKAFGTVDHQILLGKLKAMGVVSVDWFRSYLSDRQQCVGTNGTDSDFLEVTCGVPQGSILGPVLFLCYINDMPISLRCHLALYADDSALVYSGRLVQQVSDFLTQELELCRKWLVDNRLSLHIGKTECILFGTKRRINKAGDFFVKSGDGFLKRVASVKYLGDIWVILYQCLTGQEHVCSEKVYGETVVFIP